MMRQTGKKIDASSFVTDIVTNDYRTAEVFRKYGIDYCCGGKWPLNVICESKALDPERLLDELENATRTLHVSNSLQFADWDIDFIINYIIYIHHHYLKRALPEIAEQLSNFASGHRDKYPELDELVILFERLAGEMIPHMKEEEEVFFPYIQQIAHAYKDKESYASLLVRTLRKPVESLMQQEHESMGKILRRMRGLTFDYTPPHNACVKHVVTYSRLKELDSDFVQHLHLENNILFPKALAMEKDLLQKE